MITQHESSDNMPKIGSAIIFSLICGALSIITILNWGILAKFQPLFLTGVFLTAFGGLNSIEPVWIVLGKKRLFVVAWICFITTVFLNSYLWDILIPLSFETPPEILLTAFGMILLYIFPGLIITIYAEFKLIQSQEKKYTSIQAGK